MRIALTGGIACWKSLLARYLNEVGVETLDADDVVHELIPDPAERRRIAAEVFSDPAKRKALEERIHPLVKERIDEWFEKGQKTKDRRQRMGNDSSVVCPLSSVRLAIIPLLFETHWNSEYDIICCVASERETQIARMVESRGYTREEAEARLAAQLPVAEKAAKSHYVIDNNGTPEELKEKTKQFVNWLRAAMS